MALFFLTVHYLPWISLLLLAWRVKQRKSENTVHAIKTASGALVGQLPDILKEFEKYYGMLYQSTSLNEQDQVDFFKNTALFWQITDCHSKFLDKPITQDKIKEAVRSMKTGKAAGPDGGVL